MNPIERLREHLSDLVPAATLTLDPPGDPHGAWFLDIEHAGRSLVVEWRHDRGFGLSAPSPSGDDYGLGPDEVMIDLKVAADRIASLLRAGKPKPSRQIRHTT